MDIVSIHTISESLLSLQKESLEADVSDVIKKIEGQIDAILSKETNEEFGQAVMLKFSLLKTIQKRIGQDSYVEKMSSAIDAIAQKTLPDSDENEEMQQYLDFLRGQLKN